jgi:hypothetical protein
MTGGVFMCAAVALGWSVAVTGAVALVAASAPAAAASAAPAPLPLAHPQTTALVNGLLKSWYAPAARPVAGPWGWGGGETQRWWPPPAH